MHFLLGKDDIAANSKSVQVREVKNKIKPALEATLSGCGINLADDGQFVGVSFIKYDTEGQYVSSDLFTMGTKIAPQSVSEWVATGVEEIFSIVMLHIKATSWTNDGYAVRYLDKPFKKAARRDTPAIMRLLADKEWLQVGLVKEQETNQETKQELAETKGQLQESQQTLRVTQERVAELEEELRKVKVNAREDKEVSKRSKRGESKKVADLERELKATNAKATKMQEHAREIASHAGEMQEQIAVIGEHLRQMDEHGRRMGDISQDTNHRYRGR